MSVLVLRGARLKGHHLDLYAGTLIEVEFDLSAFFEGKAKRWRQFWEGHGSKFFRRDSMVILAFGVVNGAATRVFLALVQSGPADPKRKGGSKKGDAHASLILRFPNALERSDAIELALHGFGGGHNDWIVQLRNNFVLNTLPVLGALQGLRTFDIVQRLAVLVPHIKRNLIDNSPDYMRGDDPSLDLSMFGMSRAVPVRSYDDLRAQLLAAQMTLRQPQLDAEQQAALALALTRRVSLIQGPPGAGKSYVGARIVAAMLKNAEKMGITLPIVCLCFTNHALDQFLSELCNQGLVSIEKVVRIGGRSKHERLMERALVKLRHTAPPATKATARITFGQTRTIANGVEADVETLTRRLSQSPANWEASDRTKFIEFVEFALGMEEVAERLRSACPDDVGSSDDASRHTAPAYTFAEVCEGECAEALDMWRSQFREKLRHMLTDYDELVERAAECNEMRDLELLRAAKVVGVTTTGAAMYGRLIGKLGPSVLVCEEAGEVFESHLFAALSGSVEQLVLIGDHQQQRPKANEYSLSVDSGKPYKLDRSMFERLVQQNEFDMVTLQTQRRMRTEIADCLRATLYPKLRDDLRVVGAYPDVAGLSRNLLIFDHDWPEDEENLSYRNKREAEMTVALVQYLFMNGYEGDRLAVLTPYVGQLLLLRKLLGNLRVAAELGDRDMEMLEDLEDDDEGKDEAKEATRGNEVQYDALRNRVRLSTVDNFQGEEADVVVVSTVWCNKQARVGFLKIDNRVNVMLSRARHGMVVLGSRSTIERARGGVKTMLHRYIEHLGPQRVVRALPLRCQRHGRESLVADAAQLQANHGDGGCDEMCAQRMACGHPCERRCHVDDPTTSASCACSRATSCSSAATAAPGCARTRTSATSAPR